MATGYKVTIPTWDNGVWTKTTFLDKDLHIKYMESLFKEPGEYDLDETSFLFNAEAVRFRADGDVYCMHPFRSKDFEEYWDDQKDKNVNGVLFKNKNKAWYLPRDYYMWLNFLPIYDKAKKDFDFPEIRDVQLHIAMYEYLAELHGEHASILKKRQIASSYFHMAKFINRIWFDPGAILKMGASLKDFINLAGSWKFLEEYRAFLNGNTAWYRPMNPGKVLEWQQKIEVRQGNRKKEVGLKGMIQGMSFEQSDTKGVGGPCTIFFYEEGGIAPKADKTYEFLLPAMKEGDLTTGIFIIAGSVGKLSDAEPLKEFTNHPKDNDIYAVETDLIDEKGTRGLRGLFIPEQWSMKPYIDNYGNSLVQEALASLEDKFAQWKKKLSPQRYQLRVSQHPRNIKEAFASRDISRFPTHLIEHQTMEIEDGAYPYELVDIVPNSSNELVIKLTNKAPIDEFPIKKNLDDKTGSIVMWERPDEDIKPDEYIVSIDPVGVGKTTTSESLVSVYVYKMPTQVTRYTDDGVETFIEGDKIVCAWCGRFDDINDTHERIYNIIMIYQARALIENNITNFIQYMISKRASHRLIPKTEMVFLKEIQANKSSFQDYGWRNTGDIFDKHLLDYLVNWLKNVVEEEIDDDGIIRKKFYGIRRLPDIMALKEMTAYQKGVNVDRLIALAALIAFITIKQSNRGIVTRTENEIPSGLEKSQNLYNLKGSAFRNIGRKSNSSFGNRNRSVLKRRR